MKHVLIFPFFLVIAALVFVSGTANAGEMTPQQLVKIKAERTSLVEAKKESLSHCSRFKSSNPQNYSICVSVTSAKFDSKIHMLMTDQGKYFAKGNKKG